MRGLAAHVIGEPDETCHIPPKPGIKRGQGGEIGNLNGKGRQGVTCKLEMVVAVCVCDG